MENINSNYTWISFFKAVHNAIHEKNYNAKSLANIANKIFGEAIHDQINQGENCPLIEISPITFLLQYCRDFKNKNDLCKQTIEIMNLQGINIPTDFDGIPTVDHRNYLCMQYYYQRSTNVIKNQWDLSKFLYENKKENYAQKFDEVLDEKEIALTYLSNFLYLINPEKFFPYTQITQNEYNNSSENIDTHNSKHPKWDYYEKYCTDMAIGTKMLPYEYSYSQHLKRLQNREYSYNLFAKLLNLSPDIIPPKLNKKEGIAYFQNEELYKVTNHTKAYANIIITINDENFELNSDKVYKQVREKIINKMKKYNTNPCSEPNSNGDIDMKSQPLNQILYGPPGTGKTYNTVIEAMKILQAIEQPSFERYKEWFFENPPSGKDKISKDYVNNAFSELEKYEDELKKQQYSLFNVTTKKELDKYSQKIKNSNTWEKYERHQWIETIVNNYLKFYNESILNYKKLQQRFEELRKQGVIKFVTFHQSYSYEEFVEGIKPDLNSSELSYKLEKGSFMEICDSAKELQKEKFSYNFKFKNLSLYKILIPYNDLFEYCLENDCIAIGWGEEINLENCDNNKISELIPADYPHRKQCISQLNIFKKWIDDDLKEGKDVIAIIPGSINTIKAIAKITGDYSYNDEIENGQQQRKVEWIKKDINISSDYVYSAKFVAPTITGMYKEKINENNLMKLLNGDEEQKSKNAVLIIDEINRGNISKIFGELITLIEEDKRENMTVTLPYSKDPFTVPKNLYIIGTMNTADRSIASVDIALRRRFKFIEMMPKPELLIDKNDNYEITVRNSKNDKTELYKINLQVLLKTLNERISYLLDPDHQIGHSYFLNLLKDENGNKKDYILESDLKDVFKYEILPLLNEYFYDDWDKLLSVLIDNDKDESNKKYIIDINNSFIKEDPALSLRCDYNTNSKRYSFRINDNDFNIRTAIECVGENIISPAEIRNVKTEEVEPNE